jgi:Uncharacterized membrane protein (homolog of Drosophila rhomboid)
VIPFADADPTKGSAPVNRLLLFANIVVWLYIVSLQRTPGALEAFFDRYAFDWSRFTHDLSTGAWTFATLAPLVTHMFLHGGWLHIIGNMLYLWCSATTSSIGSAAAPISCSMSCAGSRRPSVKAS